MRSPTRLVFFALAQLCGLGIAFWSLRWPLYDFWMLSRMGDRWIPSFDTANDPGMSGCIFVLAAAILFVLSAIPILPRTRPRRALLVFALTAIEGLAMSAFVIRWHTHMFLRSRARVTQLALDSARHRLRIGITEPEVERAIAQVNLSLVRPEEGTIALSATEKHLRDSFAAQATDIPPGNREDLPMGRFFTRGKLEEEEQIHRYGRTPFRGSMDAWLQEMIEVVYGEDHKLVSASYRTLDHHWNDGNGEEVFQCRILWEIPAKASHYPIIYPCRGEKGSPSGLF